MTAGYNIKECGSPILDLLGKVEVAILPT